MQLCSGLHRVLSVALQGFGFKRECIFVYDGIVAARSLTPFPFLGLAGETAKASSKKQAAVVVVLLLLLQLKVESEKRDKPQRTYIHF